MRDVGANAQIDHRPATVYSGGGAVRDLSLDDILLVFIVLRRTVSQLLTSLSSKSTHPKHLEKSLLGYDKTLKLLFLFDCQICDLLECRIVAVHDRPTRTNPQLESAPVPRCEQWLCDAPVLDGHLVEKAIFGRRADAKVATVVAFGSLTEDVCRRMPEHALSFWMLKVKQF